MSVQTTAIGPSLLAIRCARERWAEHGTGYRRLFRRKALKPVPATNVDTPALLSYTDDVLKE